MPARASLASPSDLRRPPPVAGGTRQRRKEARPQELLDAALDLFVEKGFAATRSEQVAARAGVSKGTLYLYYPSKEELLKEVIRANVSNQIREGFEIVRTFEGSSRELFSTVYRLWWQRVGETRASGILKLMMSEVRNFPDMIVDFWIDEVTEPAGRLMAMIIERGIASGEFRPVAIEDAVHALVAPLMFLVMNKHSLGACSARARLDANAIIEAQIDLALNGLAAGKKR